VAVLSPEACAVIFSWYTSRCGLTSSRIQEEDRENLVLRGGVDLTVERYLDAPMNGFPKGVVRKYKVYF
jgi:hypothetical protein